jgi:hypothetical protein
MKNKYNTDLFTNSRLIILKNNDENIANNYNQIEIKNIKIKLKRDNTLFSYIISKKNNDSYVPLFEDHIEINDFDKYWLKKEYKYIEITRNDIYSIFVNIIYKNNFNYLKETFIQYKFNTEKNYSDNYKSLNITYNTTKVNGYFKILIDSSKLIYNSILYNKNGHGKDFYLYNIKKITDTNLYDIKPLDNVPISGDYSIKLLNEKDEKIEYDYIYIQEHNIKYEYNNIY